MWCPISNWMYKWKGVLTLGRALETCRETCDDLCRIISLEVITYITCSAVYLFNGRKFFFTSVWVNIDGGTCTWNRKLKPTLNPPVYTEVGIYICIQHIAVNRDFRCFLQYLKPGFLDRTTTRRKDIYRKFFPGPINSIVEKP